jgi:peptidoglycan/LPS O-acetylase OafA/YrhL
MNIGIAASGSSTRLASLGGWRAISIALVLGCHCRNTYGFPKVADSLFDWLFDGFLGVQFFFVISGFLITFLMVLENDQAGRVSIRHFYVRRALRILPVYFAFMLALIGLQLFTAYHQSPTTWIGNFTFTTDFVTTTVWTSGHLWSLSVEEQFYLLWPPIFVWGITKCNRLIFCLSALPILIAPICRALTVMVWNEHHCPSFLLPYYPVITVLLKPLLSYYSFFNYFDSLAVGCMGAVLFARQRFQVETYLKTNRLTSMMAALALILIPYTLRKLALFGSLVWPLGYTLEALGFVILLLQSIVSPQAGFNRALNWPWVSRIGVLSYSIYIWQQIFSAPPQAYGMQPVWWLSFPGWLVPVFTVALVSYYGFERPLLKLRSRFREV